MKHLHTHHYGVMQSQDIPRFKSTLSSTCVRFIKFMEDRLKMNCTKVWWQCNPKGEAIMFGKFCHGKEWIPVTLGFYYERVGWVTMNRDVIEFNLAHHP